MKIEYELLLKHDKHKTSEENYIGEGSPYIDKDKWNYLYKCRVCGIELIGVKTNDKTINGHFVWQGSKTDFNLPLKKIRQELSNCGFNTGGTL